MTPVDLDYMRATRWLPTEEQQAEIETHWAGVRAGIRKDAPEPDYQTPQEVLEMHRYLARKHIEIAASHAKRAMQS